MKPVLTIQQMLDDLSGSTVMASEITDWLVAKNGSVLKDRFWELNNDLCEGILADRWEVLTDLEKFQRLFEVIELWPSYSTASYLPRLHTTGIEVKAEAFLWRKIVLILEQGDPLHKEAIEYVLWVDFFEDPATSAKAWAGVMNASPGKKATERLMINSGPVPYSEKRRHYYKLFKNPKNHECLAECLARSLQDLYGSIDRTEAKEMVAKLNVKPANKFMSYLRDNL